MPFYKIVKAFCVPPGIFVTAFLLVAILLSFNAYCCRKYSKRLFVATTVMSLFCYLFAGAAYGLSINAGAARLMRSLEYQYERATIKPDAIFVLGGNDGSRDRTGAALQKKYGVDIIPSGYNGEAERMQKVMLKSGVEPEKIILETKATNTKDHVKYLLPIAKEKGYKRVYIVTSASHMPRSMLLFKEVFRKNGIDVVPYPCGYTVPRIHRVIERFEWIPNMASLWIGFNAWTEYLGFLQTILSR